MVMTVHRNAKLGNGQYLPAEQQLLLVLSSPRAFFSLGTSSMKIPLQTPDPDKWHSSQDEVSVSSVSVETAPDSEGESLGLLTCFPWPHLGYL